MTSRATEWDARRQAATMTSRATEWDARRQAATTMSRLRRAALAAHKAGTE